MLLCKVFILYLCNTDNIVNESNFKKIGINMIISILLSFKTKKIYISKKIEKNIDNENQTYLFIALKNDNFNIVKILLEQEDVVVHLAPFGEWKEEGGGPGDFYKTYFYFQH